MQNKPAPQEIETWRYDGSLYLFWDFLKQSFLLVGAGICFGTAIYLYASLLGAELPKLMEVLK